MTELFIAGLPSGLSRDADLLKRGDSFGGAGVEQIGGVVGWLFRKVMSSGVHTVATDTALKALTRSQINEQLGKLGSETLLITVATDGDGKRRTYLWDSTSTAPASSGIHVPTESGTGRWISLPGQGLATSGVDVTAKIATLDVLPTTPVYVNGTAGVGATLTAGSNGAFAAEDGETPAVGTVYLVWKQASKAHNGLYVLSTLGSGSAKWVLTRLPGYDTSSGLTPGMIVRVTEGVTYGDRNFQLVANDGYTMGTSSLDFVPLSGTKELHSVPVAAADRVTNTDSETAFATTFPIAADSVPLGSPITVRALAKVVAVNGSPTLAFQLRVGGVAGTSVLALPAAAMVANDYAWVTADITVAKLGASGAVHANVSIDRSLVGAEASFRQVSVDLALDTTAAMDVALTAQWSAIHAGNQVELRMLHGEMRTV